MKDLGASWAGGGHRGGLKEKAALIGIKIKERYARANDTELWPEHREAFETFCACATQWRVIAGMGGAIHQGIDYTALESVMRMRGIEDQAASFEQIRLIESGALGVINKR
ncbi:DUF1799 domain-containing protein [Chromohalobacter sp. TMW 2.2271]|uniref:DUF1799 domain-containing protein n=1 Tax=Chromohalobacter sp. TMW 2.2271 TaxID=2860330 RepID=UPI003014ED8B